MMAKLQGAEMHGRSMHSSALNQLHESPTSERLIGAILRAKSGISADDVEQILHHARKKGVRFGDAAVALRLVTQDEVLQALAEQFGYPYATEERRRLRPELVGLNQPFSLQAEAIRQIRSQLIMTVFMEGQQRPALAVVSPASGDGKTYFKYKNSDVGPRIWKEIVASPVWFPPEGTPTKDLLTRKTLGGLETDLSSRALTAAGSPLPGLFAAGEAAGFGGGGMHGYRSLEGTFLGGCLFSGRSAGRAAAGNIT